MARGSFKMRSGNSPLFKQVGSSPAKKDVSTAELEEAPETTREHGGDYTDEADRRRRSDPGDVIINNSKVKDPEEFGEGFTWGKNA
jgi:hypothetical protein